MTLRLPRSHTFEIRTVLRPLLNRGKLFLTENSVEENNFFDYTQITINIDCLCY